MGMWEPLICVPAEESGSHTTCEKAFEPRFDMEVVMVWWRSFLLLSFGPRMGASVGKIGSRHNKDECVAAFSLINEGFPL